MLCRLPYIDHFFKKALFLSLFIMLVAGPAYTQCVVTACPDVVICKGGGAFLNASAPFANAYEWSPAAGLNQTYVPNPVAHPSVTSQYVVTAYTVVDTNLIANGSFELGNVGFSSNYTYNGVSVWNEATYAVNASPTAVHPNFATCADHTTGSGKMMIVNGAAAANTNVWCQTVNVLPNTDYAFSTWLASCISASPAILQFSINSVILGSPFGASSQLCLWQQFYEVWNSGASTTAQICIVNQNTAQSGNDFLLDDISFQPFCVATDTVNVIIDQVPADAGADTMICKGSMAHLSGHGGQQYHWSTGANTQTLNVGLYTPAVYYVTVTDSIGCKGEDSVHVGIYPLPIAEAGPNQWICRGDTATLQASGGISYAWSNGANAQIIAVSPVQSSILHVMVTDTNSCSSLDSMMVFINPNPVVDVGPDRLVCSGDSIDLMATGTGSFLWSTGQTTAAIRILPLQSEDIWVLLTDIHGCYDADTMLLSLGIQPATLILAEDTLLCIGASTQLSGSGATSYQWYPSAGLSDTTSASIVASPEATTIYYCIGYNNEGCRDTTSIHLIVSDCSVNIPNVFTPNADGKNDLFEIEYEGFAPYKLKIFNRWGKKVYESERKENLWDGNTNSGPAADGVYFYLLSLGEKTYQGSVTIFRN